MTSPRNRTACLLLALSGLGVISGCAEQAGQPSGAVVRDSSGVRIVENHSVSGVVSGWSVGPEPIFRVGWAPGEPEFQNVRAGFLAADGRVVVADAGSNVLHVLSPTGASLATIGGPGQGPGEFGRIGRVHPISADSFFVSDGGNARVTVFHGEDYAYDRHFENFFANALYDPVGRTEDGSYVLLPGGFLLGALSDAPEGWISYPILRTSDFAHVDTVASVPLMHADTRGNTNPVRHFGAVIYTGGQIAFARSDQPQVTWMDIGGSVRQIARWDATPTRLTDDDWPQYELGARARASPNIDQQQFEQRLRERRRDFGGTLPLFRLAVGDRTGNVWLAEYDLSRMSESTYSTLSRSGHWLGTVVFPARIRLLDITEDRVLGVELDEFDVNAVVLYELLKSEG